MFLISKENMIFDLILFLLLQGRKDILPGGFLQVKNVNIL
jgi:hypothetical protein